MRTATAQATQQQAPPATSVSWEEFQRKYLGREDGYKYEWLNGVVEKTKRSMDKTQLYILRNLLVQFRNLFQAGKVTGELISEPDLFFLEHHRRPDIAWLTDEQINRLAYNEKETPAFIIEVISHNDQINKVAQKMDNYRDAGVKVVWQVFPLLNTVHVYGGDRLTVMHVKEGDQLCLAAPVLDFSITVNALLKKPIL